MKSRRSFKQCVCLCVCVCECLRLNSIVKYLFYSFLASMWPINNSLKVFGNIKVYSVALGESSQHESVNGKQSPHFTGWALTHRKGASGITVFLEPEERAMGIAVFLVFKMLTVWENWLLQVNLTLDPEFPWFISLKFSSSLINDAKCIQELGSGWGYSY